MMDLISKSGVHDQKTHGNWARQTTRIRERVSSGSIKRTSVSVFQDNDKIELLAQIFERSQTRGGGLSETSHRERLLASNEIETFVDAFGADWLGALTAHRQGNLSEFVTKAHNRLLVDEAWNERIDFYSELLTKRGTTRFERLLANAGGEGDVRERQVADIFKTAFDSGGRTASVVTDHIIEFDPNHPRVVAWVEDNATELITEIDAEARDIVKVMIRESIEEGTSEEILKGRIANVVGLDERRRRAVARFEVEQIRQGVPPGRVDRLAKAYGRRLREQRAESIVRTEIQKAVEAGKLEFWKQAADSGLITRGESWRSWVVHDDEKLCPWCRPVEGKRARLGGQFFTPLGKVLGPPLHINCRCWTELEAPLHLQTPIIKHPHHTSSQKEHGNWARGGARRTTGAPDYIPLEDAGKTRRQKVDDALADRDKAQRKVKKPGRLPKGSIASRRRNNKGFLRAHRTAWSRDLNPINRKIINKRKNWSNAKLAEHMQFRKGEMERAMRLYAPGGLTAADTATFNKQLNDMISARKEPSPKANKFDSPSERKRLKTTSPVGRSLDIAANRKARASLAEKLARGRNERIAAAKKRAEDDK